MNLMGYRVGATTTGMENGSMLERRKSWVWEEHLRFTGEATEVIVPEYHAKFRDAFTLLESQRKGL